MARKLKKFALSRRLLLAVIVLIIMVVVGILLIRTNKQTISTIPSKTPGQTIAPKSSSTPTNSSSSNLTDSSKPAPTSSQSGAGLVTPYGTFVSNHHPTTSGSPGPSEESVCNTTPGASCYIEFTKGNTTKKLQAQTVDASGSAYWSWNINDAGLSVGSWAVTVYASLNGKTLTATDVLEVQS